MTGTELLAFVRSLIHESEAKFWTDDELIMYLNVALRFYSTKLANGNADWYHKTSTLNFATGSNSVAAPADYNGHLDFMSHNDAIVTPIEYDQLFDGTVGSPTNFCIRHNTVYVYPTPNTSYTLSIAYWYKPTPITSATLSSVVDFPDALAPLLGYEAALMAVLKDENYIGDIKTMRDEWWENLNYYRGRRVHVKTAQVRSELLGIGEEASGYSL